MKIAISYLFIMWKIQYRKIKPLNFCLTSIWLAEWMNGWIIFIHFIHNMKNTAIKSFYLIKYQNFPVWRIRKSVIHIIIPHALYIIPIFSVLLTNWNDIARTVICFHLNLDYSLFTTENTSIIPSTTWN